MTHYNHQMSASPLRPGPHCKRFGPLLPLIFQENLLDDGAPETEALREHLVDCVYCQAMLHLYTTQQQTLWRNVAERVATTPYHTNEIIARIQEETSMSRLPEIPASRLAEQPDNQKQVQITPQFLQPRKRRINRVVAWLTPVAAVLLIAVLAALVFTNQQASSSSFTIVNGAVGAVPGAKSIVSLHPVNNSAISFRVLSMLSATEGWAIGSADILSGNADEQLASLLLRDHNGAWSTVPFDTKPYGSQLWDISAVSPTNVWLAAGQYLLHYDGHSWTRQISVPFGNTPESRMYRVKMFSATNGLAAYSAVRGSLANAISSEGLLHYDGHKWSALPQVPFFNCNLPIELPLSSGYYSLLASGEIWTVGECQSNTTDANGNPTLTSILLHYDGYEWSRQSYPSPGANSYISAISMISPQEGWAIGAVGTLNNGNRKYFLLHYSQGQWQLAPNQSFSHLPLAPFSSIDAFSMLTTNEGWILIPGYGGEPNLGPYPIAVVLHNTGGVWKRVTLPKFNFTRIDYNFISAEMAETGWNLNGLTLSPDGGVWFYGTVGKIIHGINLSVPLLLHYANGKWDVVLD